MVEEKKIAVSKFVLSLFQSVSYHFHIMDCCSCSFLVKNGLQGDDEDDGDHDDKDDGDSESEDVEEGDVSDEEVT